MAERALIIAIEEYKNLTDSSTARKLDGTLKAAIAFRDWLEKKWTAEGKASDATVLFCSEPPLEGQSGASLDEITEALDSLQKTGRDTTDNLYVYFSGHGFRLSGETLKLADVLVAGDFKNVTVSASRCLKLGALIEGLRTSLRNGCHFYFIDACRNEVKQAIASSIMPFEASSGRESSVFVLQSAIEGSPSLVGGPFATKLLEGLKGHGTAKDWEPPAKDHMIVHFVSLFGFLEGQLKGVQPIFQNTTGEKSPSKAVLATIKPVPRIKLTLNIKTVLGNFVGKVKATPYHGPVKKHDITGKMLVLNLPPDYYTIEVTVAQLVVVPAGAVAVELFEDQELTFELSKGGARRGPFDSFRSSGPVRVNVPEGREVVLRHLRTGQEDVFRSSKETSLPIGDYMTKLRVPNGPVILSREISVARDKKTRISAHWKGSLAKESIAKMFPPHHGGLEFSESLGGVITDPDLSLWLAILGGGRIIGSQGDYSKIGRLPLRDFSSEAPGSSPVYLLAGFPDSGVELSLGLSTGGAKAKTKWFPATEPRGMKGLQEVVVHPPQGQCFITLAVGRQPTYTLASFASPDRCTLIVLTLDEEGAPRVEQYLLPMGHLIMYLDPSVRQRLEQRNQLKDVKVLAQLSGAFRKRHRIAAEFSSHALGNLLLSKWLDPIGASLAAYECVRRGKLTSLHAVARNMKKFFPRLPDTSAIARLAGDSNAEPHGVPLFLDGLQAFRDLKELLSYPAGMLDFSGPWTAWRGVVTPPRSKT